MSVGCGVRIAETVDALWRRNIDFRVAVPSVQCDPERWLFQSEDQGREELLLAMARLASAGVCGRGHKSFTCQDDWRR